MHALKAMKGHKWQLACGQGADTERETEEETAGRAEGEHETRIRLNASLAITSAIIMCVTRQQNGTLKGHDGPPQSTVQPGLVSAPGRRHIAFSCRHTGQSGTVAAPEALCGRLPFGHGLLKMSSDRQAESSGTTQWQIYAHNT